MPAFADLVTFFLDELFTLQPDIATAVGEHRYDDQWPDAARPGGRAGSRSRIAGARRSATSTRRRCRATTGSIAT